MSIQEWSELIWVAQLGNEPSLSEDLTQLKERALAASTAPALVLDLASVTQLNSTNLSQMLRLRKYAVDSETKLLLAGPSDSVWAVFLTTGLDKVFEFMPDVPSALAGLQMGQE